MLPDCDKRHCTGTGMLTAAGRAGHKPLRPTWLPQPMLGAYAQTAFLALAVHEYILHVKYGEVGMRWMEHHYPSAPSQHLISLAQTIPCPSSITAAPASLLHPWEQETVQTDVPYPPQTCCPRVLRGTWSAKLSPLLVASSAQWDLWNLACQEHRGNSLCPDHRYKWIEKQTGTLHMQPKSVFVHKVQCQI